MVLRVPEVWPQNPCHLPRCTCGQNAYTNPVMQLTKRMRMTGTKRSKSRNNRLSRKIFLQRKEGYAKGRSTLGSRLGTQFVAATGRVIDGQSGRGLSRRQTKEQLSMACAMPLIVLENVFLLS